MSPHPRPPPGACSFLYTKTGWLFPSQCFGCTQNLIYKSDLSHDTEINAIYYSQFRREEGTPRLARPCHPGPCGEALGGSGDRRKKSQAWPGAFTVVSLGRNGQGRAGQLGQASLGLESLDNVSRLWALGVLSGHLIPGPEVIRAGDIGWWVKDSGGVVVRCGV